MLYFRKKSEYHSEGRTDLNPAYVVFKIDTAYNIEGNPLKFLINWFPWGETPQGHVFWNDLYSGDLKISKDALIEELNKVFVLDEVFKPIEWE
jgi:hypothetical protein